MKLPNNTQKKKNPLERRTARMICNCGAVPKPMDVNPENKNKKCPRTEAQYESEPKATNRHTSMLDPDRPTYMQLRFSLHDDDAEDNARKMKVKETQIPRILKLRNQKHCGKHRHSKSQCVQRRSFVDCTWWHVEISNPGRDEMRDNVWVGPLNDRRMQASSEMLNMRSVAMSTRNGVRLLTSSSKRYRSLKTRRANLCDNSPMCINAPLGIMAWIIKVYISMITASCIAMWRCHVGC